MLSQHLPLRVLLVLLLMTLPVAAHQNFTIQKIEFEGLKRLSADEVIVSTGLKIGDPFVLAALDAAAQKLVDSGQFSKVGYKTHATKQLLTITFQVEEAVVTSSRVVFDNFIWFNDTELIGAVKRDAPWFSGTAPDNGDAIERIIKSLQRFLHENKIEASVSHMVSQDAPGSPIQEHVFTVNGFPMPICTLHFPGAKNVAEAKLVEGAKDLKGAEYSRKFVSLFAVSNLLPFYREAGQLKAAFAPPSAKPEATATCKSGVELTIGVDEGYIYKWDNAEWAGNKTLTVPELNALLGMQTGEAANGIKLDKAAKDIEKAYGRKGYLLATLTSKPEFDDQAQNVAYKMEVVEGPQFRMGRLITRGFSESETREILAKWELKQGEPYNQDYFEEFVKKRLIEILKENFVRRHAQGKPAPTIKSGNKIDRHALTADVTLELAN